MTIKIFTYRLATVLLMASAAAVPCVAQTAQDSPTFTAENYTSGEKPMMPIIMKVALPPEQMKRLAKMMRAGKNFCFVEDLQPDDDSSMLMICGLSPSVETFSNN